MALRPQQEEYVGSGTEGVSGSSPTYYRSLWPIGGSGASCPCNSGLYRVEGPVPNGCHWTNRAHWMAYIQGPADEKRNHQFGRVTGADHQKAEPLPAMEAGKDTCDSLGCL